ncbi:IS5 family transposase [Candidatus Peregrinibacteria bacterium]|nr:IS5 family transposase [Candidatus Peregrinibacteria bacterium]
MKQNSFLAIAHQGQKRLRCEKFLEEMERVMPWEKFFNEIAPYYVEQETGRKRMELSMMLKIYFLQQWYSLSDREAEEMIYDRNSFQKFLGIDLLSQKAPDETTILNFRHLLEENKLQEHFLRIVNAVLEKRGLLMREGSIVDATIIAAPSSTKNNEQKRDPEMSSTKKGNQWYFGMKAHIGVDAKSGVVHSLETTAAKTSDRVPFKKLLHGKERALFGDKAYGKQDDKREARANGILWAISDRGVPNHPLSSSQRKRNKKYSSVRSKVEHPFQVIKCQWGHVKVRYKGLFKNTMQLFALFALANLFRTRKTLLEAA